MEQILSQIWSPLFGALIAAIGLYAGYIRKLVVDVAVLKKEVENQQTTINNMTERLNAHSKNQDKVLETLNEMKLELVEKIGQMNTDIATLSSDLNNLKSLLSFPNDIKTNRKK